MTFDFHVVVARRRTWEESFAVITLRFLRRDGFRTSHVPAQTSRYHGGNPLVGLDLSTDDFEGFSTFITCVF